MLRPRMAWRFRVFQYRGVWLSRYRGWAVHVRNGQGFPVAGSQTVIRGMIRIAIILHVWRVAVLPVTVTSPTVTGAAAFAFLLCFARCSQGNFQRRIVG